MINRFHKTIVERCRKMRFHENEFRTFDLNKWIVKIQKKIYCEICDEHAKAIDYPNHLKSQTHLNIF